MYIYSSGIRELIKILNTVLERAEGVKLGTAARISVCSLRTILLLRSIPWMMEVETNCFEPFWQLRTPSLQSTTIHSEAPSKTKASVRDIWSADTLALLTLDRPRTELGNGVG